MSVFDSVVKAVVGTVAHDAADSGAPIKIGGKAASSVPAAVSASDRVDAYFDQYGRLGIMAYGAYKQVDLTPASPNPSGSDIADDTVSVIVSGDLTIRDTNQHAFYIPMAVSGYRSIIIYLENNGTAWDQTPSFVVYGCMGNSGSYRGAQLAAFDGVVTASNRICIGTSQVGQGGLTGSDPVPGMYYYYPIPALADGWPYVALYISFSSSPSQGEFDDIRIVRMA